MWQERGCYLSARCLVLSAAAAGSATPKRSARALRFSAICLAAAAASGIGMGVLPLPVGSAAAPAALSPSALGFGAAAAASGFGAAAVAEKVMGCAAARHVERAGACVKQTDYGLRRGKLQASH